MSYTIVRKVSFKDDGVYFTSASNNVYPRTFYESKSEYYSKLYAEQGLAGVVKDLAGEMKCGNIKFVKGTRFCNYMLTAKAEIDSYRSANLLQFLNREMYSNYILKSFSAKASKDVSFREDVELDKLCSLKNDPEAVFAMCKESPDAFFYASSSIQEDKALCRRFVLEFAGDLMFRYPQALLDDIDSVKLALSRHGCVFRHLPENLRDDPEVVLAAFGSEKYPEHLPDLISPRLQNDVGLMKKVIAVEPKVHYCRSAVMISNPEIVLALAERAVWLSDFDRVPEEIRNMPSIQRALASRLHDEVLDPEQKQKRLDVLSRFVLPQYLVPEQLKDAVALEYKGIVFDEWTVDQESGGIWGELCQGCADTYKELLSDELSEGGVGACSVFGCDVVGADCDNEQHFYVDFHPELIKPLTQEQLHELRPERLPLENKIVNAQVQANVMDGHVEPGRFDRS